LVAFDELFSPRLLALLDFFSCSLAKTNGNQPFQKMMLRLPNTS
jgi:hypothetical protein